MHVKKYPGVLFKIDFEKAFDKVNWTFLLQILEMKGFPPSWNDLLMNTIKGEKVAIRVNDDIGPYFYTHQELRQGDPLSPLLFDLAADALAIMIKRAVNSGILKGPASRLVENGVSILQYADDTILLLEDDLEQARK
jgi:hypothetical protein